MAIFSKYDSTNNGMTIAQHEGKMQLTDFILNLLITSIM